MLPDKTIGTVMLAGGAATFAYYTFWIIISVRNSARSNQIVKRF
jgi:hypothetical protein